MHEINFAPPSRSVPEERGCCSNSAQNRVAAMTPLVGEISGDLPVHTWVNL